MAAVCLQNAFSPTAREPLVGSGIAAQISNRHDPRNILGTIHFFIPLHPEAPEAKT